jgi:Flp pilus assembly protein TadG
MNRLRCHTRSSRQPGPHHPGRWRNEDGASAVEFALIAPIAIFLFVGIVQFGALFFLQNTMAATAHDLARRLAVGAVSTVEAEEIAQERLANWPAAFDIAITEPTPHDIAMTISVSITDALFVDISRFLGGDGNLTAQATMRKEQ